MIEVLQEMHYTILYIITLHTLVNNIIVQRQDEGKKDKHLFGASALVLCLKIGQVEKKARLGKKKTKKKRDSTTKKYTIILVLLIQDI